MDRKRKNAVGDDRGKYANRRKGFIGIRLLDHRLYCRFGIKIEKNSIHQSKNIRLSREDKWGMKHVETEPRWPVQAETVVSRHLYTLHMYSYWPDPRSLDEVEV